MTDHFILMAFVAGLGIILSSGPLGCFLIWNKMAYFGDSLAHSSILGITLGLLLGINTGVAVMLTAVCFAIAVSLLSEHRYVSVDSSLGILAHTTLSLGILILSVMNVRGVDIHAFLFGDILMVTGTDIVIIYAVDGIVLGVLYKIWNPLLRLSIHKGIAVSEGINIRLCRMSQMLLTAAVIGISVRITGILLIAAFLIIPASAARFISKTPKAMAVNAVLIGVASLIGGMMLSYYYDVPTGPSIIVSASAIFLSVFFMSKGMRDSM